MLMKLKTLFKIKITKLKKLVVCLQILAKISRSKYFSTAKKISELILTLKI